MRSKAAHPGRERAHMNKIKIKTNKEGRNRKKKKGEKPETRKLHTHYFAHIHHETAPFLCGGRGLDTLLPIV
jgi:hypothetical protein